MENVKKKKRRTRSYAEINCSAQAVRTYLAGQTQPVQVAAIRHALGGSLSREQARTVIKLLRAEGEVERVGRRQHTFAYLLTNKGRATQAEKALAKEDAPDNKGTSRMPKPTAIMARVVLEFLATQLGPVDNAELYARVPEGEQGVLKRALEVLRDWQVVEVTGSSQWTNYAIASKYRSGRQPLPRGLRKALSLPTKIAPAPEEEPLSLGAVPAPVAIEVMALAAKVRPNHSDALAPKLVVFLAGQTRPAKSAQIIDGIAWPMARSTLSLLLERLRDDGVIRMHGEKWNASWSLSIPTVESERPAPAKPSPPTARQDAASTNRAILPSDRIGQLSPAEERKLARRWLKLGDEGAMHHLVRANLGLVVKIAQDFKNSGARMEDLIQEGNVGLMIATRRFDLSRNVRLATYATFWIRACMLEHVIRNHGAVRIGTTRAHRKIFFNLRRARRKLEERGQMVDRAALAKELGVEEADVEAMYFRIYGGDVSLDAPKRADDDRTVGDTLATGEPSAEDIVAETDENAKQQALLQGALKALNEREIMIIKARYLRKKPLTLNQLGSKLGISRERVRQLEERAKAKLREACGLLPEEDDEE